MSTTGEDLIAVHLNDGVGRIAKERKRQITEEGWTTPHDLNHDQDELVRAAIAYATDAIRQDGHAEACGWPWPECWWKPSNPLRDLERAGALIAAEIDRRHALAHVARERQS